MPRNLPAKKDPIEGLGLTSPTDVHIECDAFTGSLGTLFSLAREHKVDLLGVPLGPVCEAYFRHVHETAGGDIDRSAVALVALAYLLERKAWQLLPSEQEVEAPDEDIAKTEPWIQEFAPAISALSDLAETRNRLFFRTSDGPVYELPYQADDLNLSDLAMALERLLARALPDPPDGLRQPARSLTEQMSLVMNALTTEWRSLDRLVTGEFTRTEAVWWFLALLELIRIGQAKYRSHEGEVEFRSEPGRIA